jgi:hypothetical protein
LPATAPSLPIALDSPDTLAQGRHGENHSAGSGC